ncbi:MAG: molybdopterin molybdotransferase MoeA [Deltaproteobacteria bacterium]|nr:molybdopterin molybdotransferase MoeA [Deltaproteobacteria bacterium]
MDSGYRQDVSLTEAQRLVLENVGVLGIEDVPLGDALGRRLAAGVVAPRDYPPFDNSAMDGFAVRHRDAVQSRSLEVVGTATAGGSWEGSLGAGQAVKIMTGARVPQGADTVVMKEVCRESGGRAEIVDLPEPGANIRRAGEDIAGGEVALRAGTLVGPVEIAALASMGFGRATVFRRPVVAILATGNELVDVGESVAGDKIVNSNSPALAALVTVHGGVPRMLGIARDAPGEVERLLTGAADADMIATTGGVSVGEFDFVKGSLAAMGCKTVFWRAKMRPGMPSFFGLLNGRPVFGLPGNAVSSMVTFSVLARPALAKMAGDPDPLPPPHKAVLLTRVTKKQGFVFFLRARVSWKEGGMVAEPMPRQGSHMVFGQRGANALIVLPADVPGAEAGAVVDVIPFGRPAFE